MSAVPGVAFVCGVRRPGVDGIHEYAVRMSAALRHRGARSAVYDLDVARHGARRRAWEMLQPELEEFELVALQYNPFAFGERGVAPWLVPAIGRLERRRGSVLLLMVHEAHVDPERPKWVVLHLLQRAQLRLLKPRAALITTTVGRRAPGLRRGTGAPVVHLPVGSNLPCAPPGRAAARAAAGVAAEALVLAAFGTDHPTRQLGAIVRAANHAAPAGPVVVANLGANARPLAGLVCGVREIRPGPLPGAELAMMLRCADVFVHPLSDGLSTKRTTLMAALQHALPVVGTRGSATDPLLEEPGTGIELVDAGDAEGLARAVARLAADPAERARRAVAARALFDRCFAWDVLARRLIAELPGGRR